MFFFFSSRRRHTSWNCDWSSDVCSSDLGRNRVQEFRSSFYLTIRSGVSSRFRSGSLTDYRIACGKKRERFPVIEIGRASCREKVKNVFVGGFLNNATPSKGLTAGIIFNL